MEKPRSRGLMLALLAMGVMDAGHRPNGSDPDQIDPYKQAEINRKKGLKMFRIDGKVIWALNEKNAYRKANKQP